VHHSKLSIYFTNSGQIGGEGEWHCIAAPTSAPHTSVLTSQRGRSLVGEGYACLPSLSHCFNNILCSLSPSPGSHSLTDITDTADALRVRFPAAKLVICGDFNCIDISDLLHQLHLTQIVDFPTHGQTTLDLIITDLSQQYTPPQPLPPMGRSSHLSVLWAPILTTSLPKTTITKTHRPLPDSAIRRFGQWIVQHPWTEVTAVDDVNTKWLNYTRTTTEAFHHFFPVKSFPLNPSNAP